MALSRRRFLGNLTTTAAAAGAFTVPLLRSAPAFAQAASAPQTPFEAKGKTAWTTHDEEVEFLQSILGTNSPNTFLFEEIGRTEQLDLPLHLLTFGTDDRGYIADPGTRPTVYIICSQHGNEPAGREAGIELIRDLAFTADPDLLALLETSNIIITPTANPDGRQRNARENGITDINRDHLNLRTNEAQAFARVSNLWRPYMIVDHHEYGPGQPVVYDDDLLFLWPRNLNVDEEVRAGARSYCFDYLKNDAEAAGYTADVYGLQKVGPNFGPVVTPVDPGIGAQTAGDWDDGIARNSAGLRHTMGILCESAVSARAYDPTEANLARRVDSHRTVMDATLRFLKERGAESMATCAGAAVRKAAEGAAQGPVYFDGQDDPQPSQNPASLQTQTMDDPGAIRYRFPAELLDGAQGSQTLTGVLGLHEIEYAVADGQVTVEMAQHAKPLIPLLLDGRGSRSAVEGTPEY